MNLLIFNLGMDKNDAPLSFTIEWVNELAKHCNQVVVLTMSTGEYNVSENVTVYEIGHRKRLSKLRLLYNFYTALIYILWKYRIDGVFSHMNQLFSALGGIIIRLSGKKLITWYAHPSISNSLKIAHFLSNYMVASVYEAYPYKKNKLKVIGQGINTDLFKKHIIKKEPIILYTGRVSRSKDIGTLIKALKIIENKFPNFMIKIYGNVLEMDGSDYITELKLLIDKEDLSNKVKFYSAISRSLLPEIYSASKIFINLTPAGFGDKVAWEAMSCETPTLVANPGMVETLGKFKDLCFFEFGNEKDLAKKITGILELRDEDRVEIGKYLREQVIKLHSLEALPSKVLNLFK